MSGAWVALTETLMVAYVFNTTQLSLAQHLAEAVSVFFTLDIRYAQFQSRPVESVSSDNIPMFNTSFWNAVYL